jgi:hypothetical protein
MQLRVVFTVPANGVRELRFPVARMSIINKVGPLLDEII